MLHYHLARFKRKKKRKKKIPPDKPNLLVNKINYLFSEIKTNRRRGGW